MTEPRVTRKKITDYLPDPHNANRGTERGHRMLDDSVTEVGLVRGIAADKNGVITAGNKTLQAAVDNGFTDAIEIETDGKTLIVTKRTDHDLSDPAPNNPARRAAYYDNRAGQLGLDWDPAVLLHDLKTGVDLSKLWSEDELAELLKQHLEGGQDGTPFADFGEVTPPDTISFKCGDYSGHISKEVYQSFVATYQQQQADGGEVVLDNVLKAWLHV